MSKYQDIPNDKMPGDTVTDQDRGSQQPPARNPNNVPDPEGNKKKPVYSGENAENPNDPAYEKNRPYAESEQS